MKGNTVIDSLLNAQESPAVVIDQDHRIIAANRAYCTSYGVEADTIIGRHCYEVSHRSAVPCYQNGEDCPCMAVLANNSPFEVLHVHYDHANRPDRVRIKAYPVETASGEKFVLETIHRLAPSMHITCEEMRMVGRSPAFLRCLEDLGLAAKSSMPILLQGETGVGKEMAAQHIHRQSARNGKPYIELNCAAIPETLFESELFGHERGAFTGCAGMKPGLCEMADTGTLFLDEIGELPLTMQAKLLRMLDAGEVRRIGGTAVIKLDVRIIAATNCNLLDMVAKGRFREDLYFRIAGVKIHIPSLRERRSDIPALSEALIRRICDRDKADHCHITREALDRLSDYSFPGNVRELMNILQQALTLSPDHVITVEHIRLDSCREHAHDEAAACLSTPAGSGLLEARSRLPVEFPRSLAEAEARHIANLLQTHDNDRRAVAEALGISERTLYRKIKRYNLTYLSRVAEYKLDS